MQIDEIFNLELPEDQIIDNLEINGIYHEQIRELYKPQNFDYLI